MELTEALCAGTTRDQIVDVNTTDKQGKRQKKAIIKGIRLRLYPPGFNLYRASRGVKRPEIWQTTEVEAQEIIDGAPLTYEKTIAVTKAQITAAAVCTIHTTAVLFTLSHLNK